MATYAIGDIQGCYEPLQCLLEKIDFDTAKDKLWLVGDLINRGPDSLATLRFLYSIRSSLEVVLGNHDLHLLAVYFGLRKQNKSDTLTPILEAPDAPELIHWLRQQKLMHHDATLGYALVHAGIPPIWSLDKALACAREVEDYLRGPDFKTFLAHMYGNQPSVWDDSLQGQERLRLITNYFTRMRFCSADGELELTTKENAAAAPPGFAPWFSFMQRKTRQDRILFGHWAALEGQVSTANVYALDTGCVWGGYLTAMCLETGALVQCACEA
ncbi:symmetrical bis(5'-nucleosyl)-tetraphosphatase [Cellvibrio japonicus]|uniref:Bis(5'-nucleosyl)-tetraphosphatase, symmetrical n=1 Tax=Cellvibrio japonicus (strain Ueda107) TaxID=498211 RepID=APAH_CELJU|nr:symmetrical bis(5'-nucleosyl)-tetraphosphatase [Cellvibrio japonicus]B3PKV6.1 RecName: Full=Bis(5'-nucleosyl)-tetraphosphatase, symmetrical; AltName: Full=Ap4A hydrolase; AltName: Full=Diadenosine 5',5'''-P1,P4-tetraphosphate pyrophosphohydrolase; AltName: Full=Diadenosine tetraphosphatase [Cellvibrio japonicus Ueda107]ACE84062.1 bis(5'-nucleosyl)-tetraphosphatase, symmetrical [Cellvibrio japonicus Ueda107]QEI11514.1 symmetrical bis(5'-nucleosyl)-tetraphosphatase [Cellvibrio japonicus]QEI150